MSTKDQGTPHLDVVSPPLPDDLVLTVRDLHAGYLKGVNILNGCSMEAHRDRIVGIIGANGAGKSTLLKAIIGLVPVRGGVIEYLGSPLSNPDAHQLAKSGMSMVPQSKNVFPSLTVRENIEMGLYQSRRRIRRFDLTETLALFPELEPMLKRRAGSLSGGERQMLAMARALIVKPQLLLLDEPSAGLSPIMQDAMFLKVHEIRRTGVAIVMIEQNAHRCLELADYAYVLDQGRNAHEGTGASLLHDPRIVELYLGT